MKLKTAVYTALAAASLGFTTMAQADWVQIVPTDSPFTIEYVQGNKTKTASIEYIPSPAAQIWYSNDANVDVNPQSPANVGSVVEAKFETLVDFVAACDKPTSDCTAGASGSTSDDWNVFSSDKGFNFLAIHFGDKELLFKWDDLINEFQVTGLPFGLSNYRAYSNISEVPLPAAGWLLGSALLGFVGYRRRSH